MPEVELKRKVRLSREEAGRRLIALGEALVGGPRTEVADDLGSIRFTVADELEWEFELEVDGDEVELEIELKWTDARPVAAPAAAPATRARRRAKATRRS
jgi:amphi-Trp domain-containing protein